MDVEGAADLSIVGIGDGVEIRVTDLSPNGPGRGWTVILETVMVGYLKCGCTANVMDSKDGVQQL